MQEMIEPDRTILIVSVIGLIVIWGSVAYHKFVQDSAPAYVDEDEDESRSDEAVGESDTSGQAKSAGQPSKPPAGGKTGKKRRKGGKGR